MLTQNPTWCFQLYSLLFLKHGENNSFISDIFVRFSIFFFSFFLSLISSSFLFYPLSSPFPSPSSPNPSPQLLRPPSTNSFPPQSELINYLTVPDPGLHLGGDWWVINGLEELGFDVEPNGFTLSAVIKVCSELGELRLGQCFHGRVGVWCGVEPNRFNLFQVLWLIASSTSFPWWIVMSFLGEWKVWKSSSTQLYNSASPTKTI